MLNNIIIFFELIHSSANKQPSNSFFNAAHTQSKPNSDTSCLICKKRELYSENSYTIETKINEFLTIKNIGDFYTESIENFKDQIRTIYFQQDSISIKNYGLINNRENGIVLPEELAHEYCFLNYQRVFRDSVTLSDKDLIIKECFFAILQTLSRLNKVQIDIKTRMYENKSLFNFLISFEKDFLANLISNNNMLTANQAETLSEIIPKIFNKEIELSYPNSDEALSLCDHYTSILIEFYNRRRLEICNLTTNDKNAEINFIADAYLINRPFFFFEIAKDKIEIEKYAKNLCDKNLYGILPDILSLIGIRSRPAALLLLECAINYLFSSKKYDDMHFLILQLNLAPEFKIDYLRMMLIMNMYRNLKSRNPLYLNLMGCLKSFFINNIKYNTSKEISEFLNSTLKFSLELSNPHSYSLADESSNEFFTLNFNSRSVSQLKDDILKNKNFNWIKLKKEFSELDVIERETVLEKVFMFFANKRDLLFIQNMILAVCFIDFLENFEFSIDQIIFSIKSYKFFTAISLIKIHGIFNIMSDINIILEDVDELAYILKENDFHRSIFINEFSLLLPNQISCLCQNTSFLQISELYNKIHPLFIEYYSEIIIEDLLLNVSNVFIDALIQKLTDESLHFILNELENNMQFFGNKSHLYHPLKYLSSKISMLYFTGIGLINQYEFHYNNLFNFYNLLCS